jgi:large subunit ribosomal protein L23
MISTDKILLEFRVTEKAANLSANNNTYTFEVARGVNRKEIARAVEAEFKVKVTNVNVLNQKPKAKRDRMRRGLVNFTGGRRKAMVTLAEGDKIDMA